MLPASSEVSQTGVREAAENQQIVKRSRRHAAFRQFIHHWNIVLHQTRVDMQNESQRFYLGILWWFLEPLTLILIFVVLVKSGLRFGGDDARVDFIIVGILTFQFFTGAFNSGAGSLTANRGLMNQVALPMWIFPVQNYLYTLVKYGFLLFVLFAYLWASGAPFSVHYLAFPLVLLPYFLLTLGLAILASAAVPFLPDLRLVFSSFSRLLFFTSGVFFQIQTLEPEVQQLFYLNPLAVIISSTRNVLLYRQWPMWESLLVITLCSVLLLILGLRVLNRLRYVYPKMARG